MVTDGRADFGGTDGPMTDKQMKEFIAQRGCSVLHVPMALGADVASYNLPGVTAALKFTPQALAGIFLGTITRWNDPALTAANAGVTLPARDHCGHPSFRRQRDDLCLGRLSLEGQRRVATPGGPQHVCQLAGRHRRQRQPRRRGNDQSHPERDWIR